MADIVPFKAVRPKRSKVHLVSSRPYYTYEKSHLKAKLETNPYSFLHVINPEFKKNHGTKPNSIERFNFCLLYTSPSPRDGIGSRMPSSA